jgi:hypothetical protein
MLLVISPAPTKSAQESATSDAGLLRPHRGPSEQQVGHVGASHEQDARDGDHERGEDDVEGAARRGARRRFQAGTDTLVGLRILPGELLRDGRHLELRLIAADAVPEAPYHHHGGTRAAGRLERVVPQWDPHLVVGRELEALGHHADDLGRLTVDPDRPTDHARVEPVVVTPGRIAQQYIGWRPERVVALREAPAQDRIHLEDVQGVGAEPLPLEAPRLLRVADVHRGARGAQKACER